MKVLVINCGSSSLKYQLIDMDGEKVLCKGLCERIGMESSMITHEANGHKATTPAIFPTHTEAFAEVVKKMTTGAGKCINDVSEIDAIGHRVVHGGEKFKSSCLITDEVINTLRELSPLAPSAQPRRYSGYRSRPQGVRQHSHGSRVRHRFPQHHAAEGLYVRHPLRVL